MQYDPATVVQITLPDIADLHLEHFTGRSVTQAEFEHLCRLVGGFWQHDGNPDRPHAIITSGHHSSGIINVGDLLTYPNLCEILAYSLARVIREKYPTLPPRPAWVVGSDHSDAVFSQRVAYFLRAVRADFAEKTTTPNDRQSWPRHTIPQGVEPVHVEELITMLATARRLRQGIRMRHSYPIAFSLLATLVHRPDLRRQPKDHPFSFEDRPITSHFFYDIPNWDPADEICPLCEAGSPAITEPKKNMAQLTDP